jgi:3-oxoacyl-[acyl-carrier-protein] synthase-3
MTTSGIFIQERIGARRAWALDVMQKCSSFAAGVRLARGLMRSEPATRTVLLAGGYRNGDWIDYANPRVSFMYNLAPGGGAILLRRGHPENHVVGVSLCSDGALSRLVVGLPGQPAPAGGTLEVTDQDEMRRLLAERSVPNFQRVVREALAEGGLTQADVGYLALLHMKRSGHREILGALGLTEEQSIYLSRYGHVGQFDQILSLELALAEGRVRPGDVVVGVGAGIGYSWGAVALRWGPDAAARGCEGVSEGGATC